MAVVSRAGAIRTRRDDRRVGPSARTVGAARIILVLAGSVCWPATARADWIVGAFLGRAQTQSSTIIITLPDEQTRLEIANVAYRGESFRSPPYYGVRITWIPDAHRWMAIEGEWLHAKVFARVGDLVQMRGILRGTPIDASLPLSSLVQRMAMSHGLNFILANFAVRRELGSVDPHGVPRLVAVIRAGAGPTRPHAESHVDHVPRDQYENGGLGAQVGGGLELSLWRGLGVLGEYKFTWASPEIDVAGGEAIVPARSHHFALGVSYRFSAAARP